MEIKNMAAIETAGTSSEGKIKERYEKMKSLLEGFFIPLPVRISHEFNNQKQNGDINMQISKELHDRVHEG